MVELIGNNLRKCYDRLVAVDNASFKISAGEILGIIGPNGAGKSTLIDLISGFQRSDSGTVSFAGKDISNAMPDRIARMGFFRTFQRPKHIGELSILQNTLLAASNKNGESWLLSLNKLFWQENEWKLLSKATDILEEVGLGKMVNEKGMDVSFGQLKLLNLAMALNVEARIIALDEPVAGLSPSMQQQVSELLLQKKNDYGFIVVEHNFDFLRQVATRLLLMSHGKIILEGNPEVVLNDPVALDVFLGAEVVK